MTSRRGRPRDPHCDAAILEAARSVVARRGFTGATMEEIAKSAGVGKDTLYRRWPSKTPLVIELLDRLARDAVRPTPLEIDPYFNLFVYLKDVVRLNRATDFAEIVAGLVGESARNPELAQSFQAFWRRRRGIAAPLVRDVLGPEATDDEVALQLDRLLGPIYMRLMFTGDEITDEFLWNLVAAIPSTAHHGTTTPHTGHDVTTDELGSPVTVEA